MGSKRRELTALQCVFCALLLVRGGFGLTRQQGDRIKTALEMVTIKVEEAGGKVRNTSQLLGSLANREFPRVQQYIPPAAGPVGLWPLNGQYGATDVTGNGNDGVATGTQFAPGRHGNASGAFLFLGTPTSYIDIPNNGRLDVRYSYTILAHIFPTGEAGPIFNYVGNNNAWALHFWQTSREDLFMSTIARGGTHPTPVGSGVLQQNTWNYVGGTYDSATGIASVWHNGELVGQVQIGVAEVASQFPVRVAVRDGDSRTFAGRIACLQLYNYAMTQEQIAAAEDKCEGPSVRRSKRCASRDIARASAGPRDRDRLVGDTVEDEGRAEVRSTGSSAWGARVP